LSVEAWLLFCVTETVLCFTPGPAVLLVVSLALSRGGRAAMAGSLGILGANALYFGLSATSLGAILVASWHLFFLVKWLGAAYLIWLGLRMMLTPHSRSEPAAPSGHRDGSTRRSFALGFLTQGANPKALVFFTAILPQFVDARGAVGFQLFVLGVSSVVIELVVLSVYVAMCQAGRGWARHPRLSIPLQRAGGLLLVGTGVQLAAIRRG
jgi:homoserine/homoserine lactone efflux protein